MSTSRTVAPGSLPIRLFTRGTEPEFTRSFTYHSGLENLPVLSNHIPSEELDLIRNGPLGVLLRFYESKFLWSARIVHELLVNQLVTNKKYVFWTLCGGQAMRFSLKEFKIITGLNCAPYPLENVDVEGDPKFWRRLGLMDAENQEDMDVQKQEDMDAENQEDLDAEKKEDMDVEGDPQVWKRLGLRENKGLSYSTIEEKIKDCKDWGEEDRIRLVYLFLVFRLLLARHPGKGIASKAIYLVLDRKNFEAYPWGRVAFQHLIKSVFKAKPDLSQNSYGVNGFVQVLQVWAYEAIPAIGKKCGNLMKNMMEFPPLLRWKGSRKRFRYDILQNKELVCFMFTFLFLVKPLNLIACFMSNA